jgi:hypothetical protein
MKTKTSYRSSMKKEIKDEIIDLFRTRRFTIVTHDRGSYSIYVGRYFDYDKLPDEPDYEINDGGIDDNGYVPSIVVYMTEALGGIELSV